LILPIFEGPQYFFRIRDLRYLEARIRGLRTSKASLTEKKEAKNHLVKNSGERAEGVGFNIV